MDTERDFSTDEARVIVSRTLDLVLDEIPRHAQAYLSDAIAVARRAQPLLSVPTPPVVAAAAALYATGFEPLAALLGGAAMAAVKEEQLPQVAALNIGLLLQPPLAQVVVCAIGWAAHYGYLAGAGQLEAALEEHGGYRPPSPLDDLVFGNGDPVRHT